MLDIGSKSNAVKKCLVIGLLGCALGAPAFALAQGPTIGIVVFGDSLSDPGNAFALVGGTNTPPDYSVDFFLVPDQPYARGGHHFTNGATWIEQLAQSEGLAANAQPAFRGSSAGATNYAVGSARASCRTSAVRRRLVRFMSSRSLATTSAMSPLRKTRASLLARLAPSRPTSSSCTRLARGNFSSGMRLR
jgi:phospholipase/lecithinase/hemolysin